MIGDTITVVALPKAHGCVTTTLITTLMGIIVVGIQGKRDATDATIDEIDTKDGIDTIEETITIEETTDEVKTTITEDIEMVAIAIDTIEDSTTIVPLTEEVGTKGIEAVVDDSIRPQVCHEARHTLSGLKSSEELHNNCS